MLLLWMRRLPNGRSRDFSTRSLGGRSGRFGTSSLSATRAAHEISGVFWFLLAAYFVRGSFLPLLSPVPAPSAKPSHFPVR